MLNICVRTFSPSLCNSLSLFRLLAPDATHCAVVQRNTAVSFLLRDVFSLCLIPYKRWESEPTSVVHNHFTELSKIVYFLVHNNIVALTVLVPFLSHSVYCCLLALSWIRKSTIYTVCLVVKSCVCYGFTFREKNQIKYLNWINKLPAKRTTANCFVDQPV